jgi:hypothetical protein
MILNDPNDIECDLPEEGAALGLLGLMKGISEWGWCAGWMSGIEFDLWKAEAGKRIGQETLTERQAALLRLLSEECDGWWFWEGNDGPKFVTRADWRKRLANIAA